MRIWKTILKVLPHLVIIMTAMIITLCILDYLNPLMGFLTRGMSKGLIIVWAVCSVMLAGNVAIKRLMGINKDV